MTNAERATEIIDQMHGGAREEAIFTAALDDAERRGAERMRTACKSAARSYSWTPPYISAERVVIPADPRPGIAAALDALDVAAVLAGEGG